MARSRKKNKRKRKRTNLPTAVLGLQQLPTIGNWQKFGGRLNEGRKWLWALILSFASIVGLVSGALALYPRISVNQLSPLDPAKPLSVPFRIGNEGYVSIYNVRFMCGFRNAQTNQGPIFSNIGFQNGRPPIPVLKPTESTETMCPIEQKDGIAFTSIDMSVTVQFDGWWPLRDQKWHYRVTTRKNNKGELIWLPKAESEP